MVNMEMDTRCSVHVTTISPSAQLLFLPGII